MKIEAGKRYVSRDGDITGPMERRNSSLFPWQDSDNPDAIYTENGMYRYDGEVTGFDLIALYEDKSEPKEQIMKFKVGDKVTINANGQRKYENDEANPYDEVGMVINLSLGRVIVQWSQLENSYQASDLDFAPNEPTPGKYYRTHGGHRLKYLMKGSRYFIYEGHDGYTHDYETALQHLATDDATASRSIAGEWIDKVILPPMQVTRWAILLKADTLSGYKRGEYISGYDTKEDAEQDLQGWDSKDLYEIVEMMGILPQVEIRTP